MNKDELKVGSLLALSQAKRLNKVANLASESGNYGIGCSLNILSAEESIKSAVLHAKYFLPDDKFEIDDKEFYKIFADHKTKLEHIKIITAINIASIKSWEEGYTSAKPILEQFSKLPSALQAEFKTKYSLLFMIPDWISKLKNASITLGKAIKWWEQANNDKKNGFYVGLDIAKNNWNSPASFTNDKFEESNSYATLIIDHMELMYEFDKSMIQHNFSPFVENSN